MPAPLENFLRMYVSGNNVLTPEMYDAFGGDAILDALRVYDPDAHFVDDKIQNGGEQGGEEGITGKRLVMDLRKLPASKFGSAALDLRPMDRGRNLYDPSAHGIDDVYGDVTNAANEIKPQDATWTKYAPLVVGALAPMAGAALAGAGIGAAGGTAAVTGSMAGLGAGNIATGGVQTLLTQAAQKAPQLAQQLAKGGKFDSTSFLLSLAGQGANAAGVPPWVTTLAKLFASQAIKRN